MVAMVGGSCEICEPSVCLMCRSCLYMGQGKNYQPRSGQVYILTLYAVCIDVCLSRSYDNYQRKYSSIPSSEDSTKETEPISEQHVQEPQNDISKTLPICIDIEETDDCNFCNDRSLDCNGSHGDGCSRGNDSSHDNEIINVDQLSTDNSVGNNDDKRDNVHKINRLFAKETLDNDSADEDDKILSKITLKSIWRKVTKKGRSSEGIEQVTLEKDNSFASRFYRYIFSWWNKCDLSPPTTLFVETGQSSSQEIIESVSLTSTNMSKEDNNTALSNPTVESPPEEQLAENTDHDYQQNEEMILPVDEANEDTELVPLQTTDCSEFSFDKESNDEDPMSGWEFMSEQDNCTVYYKPYGDTGLYQYKVVGAYSDITARDFLDVQVSNNYN